MASDRFKVGRRITLRGHEGEIVPRPPSVGAERVAVRLFASGEIYACSPSEVLACEAFSFNDLVKQDLLTSAQIKPDDQIEVAIRKWSCS